MFPGVRLARDLTRSTESSVPMAAPSDFALDVVAGLLAREKSLPPKYFYDAVGSELFKAICRTPAYYADPRPNRVRSRSLRSKLSAGSPEGAVLVEFGSGVRLRPGSGLSESMTTSPPGCEQQMRMLPSAGLSSGSGS